MRNARAHHLTSTPIELVGTLVALPTLRNASPVYAAMPMLAASSAARRMLDDISLVTVLCSSTAAAVDVTYSLTL